jgi:hypothetical protein
LGGKREVIAGCAARGKRCLGTPRKGSRGAERVWSRRWTGHVQRDVALTTQGRELVRTRARSRRGNEQEGRKGENSKAQKGGSEGVGGKRMDGAGTDIVRGHGRTVELESGAEWGCVAGVRNQESHAHSVDLKRALGKVCPSTRSGWVGSTGENVVRVAKGAWTERSVVAVVQLNLSLRTGAGSTAQRLRAGLDPEGAAVLSRSRERRAAESVIVGQTRRERDWCDAQASPYPSPSPSHRAGTAVVCNSHAAASGHELSRNLALRAMRGRAEVARTHRGPSSRVAEHLRCLWT